MSESTHNQPNNQLRYDELTSRIMSGYGLQICEFKREDGTLVKRYILPKYTNGEFIPTRELTGISKAKLEVINKLAEATLSAHRDSRDTTPEKKAQLAFVDRHGIHYIKSETCSQEDMQHGTQKFTKSEHRQTYLQAFGSRTLGQVTKEQEEILDFGEFLAHNSNPEKDQINQQLKSLHDKNFVRLFKAFSQAMPRASYAEIYKTALQEYVTDSINKFRHSIRPDEATAVTDKLNEMAHKKFDPTTTNLSKNWLSENVKQFGDPKGAKAVFQALVEVGDPHLTAKHSYEALVDKVNQVWFETKEETHLNQNMVVIDVEEQPHPIRGTNPIPPVGPTTDSTTVLENRITRRISNLDEQLLLVRRHINKINQLQPPLLPIGAKSTEYFKNLRTALEAAVFDITGRREEDPDCQKVQLLLYAEIERLTTELETLQKLNPTPLLKEIKDLESQIRELDEKILTASESTWYLFTSEKDKLIQVKAQAEKQLKQVQAKLTDIQKCVTWDSPTAKLDHISTRLIGFTPVTGLTPSDYLSVYQKLKQNVSPTPFTDKELSVLAQWKVPNTLIAEKDGLLFQNLMAFLRQGAGETLVADELLSKLSEKLTTIEESDINKEELTSIDFKKAYDFMTGSNPNIEELDQPSNKGILHALYLASEDPSVTTKSNPLEKRQALAKSLKEMELAHRAEKVGPLILNLKSDPEFTTWLMSGQKPEHYIGALAWIVGKNETPAKEHLFALVNMPNIESSSGTMTETFEILEDHLLIYLTDLVIQEQTKNIKTDQPPYSTWKPSKTDIQDALKWLENPRTLIPREGVKYALRFVMPTEDSPNKRIATIKSTLTRQLRVLELESSPINASEYHFKEEDLDEAAQWLLGNTTSLSDNGMKALKKIQIDIPITETTLAQKHQYYTSMAISRSIFIKYHLTESGLTDRLGFAKTQLTGFIPTGAVITKTDYKNALDKLINQQPMSPSEKETLSQAMKELTSYNNQFPGLNPSVQANALIRFLMINSKEG